MGDSYENWRVIEQTFVEPNYSLLSSAVLLYYDYLLTMQSEVRLVWRTPWSLATTFYIFIRYGIIIVTTLAIVHNFYISASGLIWTIETCKVLTIIGIIVNALNFAVVSAFVAIRISAIWSRNWWLGAFLFFVGLVNPACITDLLAFGFKAIPGPHPLVACVSYLKTDHNHLGPLIIKYFPISSSAISIVYELLCLSLTALKTLSLYREQRNTGISTRLTSLLLRDGILYFTTLSALALVNIISACLPLGLIPYDVQINSTLTRV
ncbi:hypothetical protein C8Q70DRAFT_1052155 [Cubamyces menziesii]|nr:hypothetical protein C8Q70DRAFT_1052155 [Cubamyces menziesii]